MNLVNNRDEDTPRQTLMHQISLEPNTKVTKANDDQDYASIPQSQEQDNKWMVLKVGNGSPKVSSPKASRP
jgi:hypothetical protein